jgi:hypothetical protein
MLVERPAIEIGNSMRIADEGGELMKGENWACPYCGRLQTITDGQSVFTHTHLDLRRHKYGSIGLRIRAIACANPECGDVTVRAMLGTDECRNYTWHFLQQTQTYRLRPESQSKPQPDYIPQPIRDDYYEACRILELSAKSSGTLARRCLQGMIRDFCGIAKDRLIEEIRALDKAVAEGRAPPGVLPDSVEAIDHVRGIGNIGAHMEKDVNLIIPIEPHEAQALIDLIELLFEEWYVAREQRREKLERLKGIAIEKSALKSASKVKEEVAASPVRVE